MKKIKTESGQKIAASYKSQLYRKWRERHKIDAVLMGEEEREGEEERGERGEGGGGRSVVGGGGGRFGQRGGRRGRGGGTVGRGRGHVGGGGGGGRGKGRTVGDLKTNDEILRKRKKRQFQAARKAHKTSTTPGRGRHK